MVTVIMLRTYKGKWVFSEKDVTGFDLNLSRTKTDQITEISPHQALISVEISAPHASTKDTDTVLFFG